MTNDIPNLNLNANPMLNISAELLFQLSKAAGLAQFAMAARFTPPRDPAQREKQADAYDWLSEQACALLSEQCPEWVDRRAEQEIASGEGVMVDDAEERHLALVHEVDERPLDHLFIDGEEVINSIQLYPRCPACSATPGIVVQKNEADNCWDWEPVETHVDCPVVHGDKAKLYTVDEAEAIIRLAAEGGEPPVSHG